MQFFLSFLLTFLIYNTFIFGGGESESKLKILELLPGNLLVSIAIDPEIPSDFVAMSLEGKLDIFDGVYWGQKQVLKSYFKDLKVLPKRPTFPKQPIFLVKLGYASQQEVENPPTVDSNTLKEMGLTDWKVKKCNWGIYPVCVCEGSYNKTVKLCMALVGLNDPNGWTMRFQIIFPETSADHARVLWENFIRNTKQLLGKEFLKVYGFTVEDGHTIFDKAGLKLKIVAEERESDKKVQLAFIPLDKGVTFKFKEVKSDQKLDMLQVQGTLQKKEKATELIMDHIFYVSVKKVKTFSLDPKKAKRSTGITFADGPIKPKNH